MDRLHRRHERLHRLRLQLRHARLAGETWKRRARRWKLVAVVSNRWLPVWAFAAGVAVGFGIEWLRR